MACHRADGPAAATPLNFIAGNDQSSSNENVFRTYITSSELAYQRLLSKVKGELEHGGNSVLSSGSSEYKDLEQFVFDVAGVNNGQQNNTDFFQSLERAPTAQILRRASILLAGSLPTENEISQAEQGEEVLRDVLRALMQGENFHNFLIRSANDRLLTDGFLEQSSLNLDIFDPFNLFYPNLANRKVVVEEQAELEQFYYWLRQFNYGVVRAPLELIAYVVENDLPYTEILTADYTMVNSHSNEIFNSGLDFTGLDYRQFKKGKNRGQIFLDRNFVGNFIENIGVEVAGHSGFLEYPHTGLLNDPVFLNRYPSTETNRNRARARWTYYHFLGIDIEKSASRTTDPVALADTNNPTLNNPNCTVCHSLLDPLAGAFQNYGDEGFYRNSFGGLDALPETYKMPEGGAQTPYIDGDTWYRDMLSPGYRQNLAPSAEGSLRWLAEQIIADIDFAKSVVRFWWPALMTENLIEAPENSSDSFYADDLQLYRAQQAFINQLAEQFSQGIAGGTPFNLKDMLIELVLSDWFSAGIVTEPLNENRVRQLQSVGIGRLLTPEELEQKTRAVTGIAWGEVDADWTLDGKFSRLDEQYKIYYGGVDSVGITQRARELNSLMSNVALAQAVSVSCPAVIFDFNKPEQEKLIFKSVDRHYAPDTVAVKQFEVTSQTGVAKQELNFEASLNVPADKLHISFDTPYWDEASNESVLLLIHEVTIFDQSGANVANFTGENFAAIENIAFSKDNDGNNTSVAYTELPGYSAWLMWNGYIEIPIALPAGEGYRVQLSVSRTNVPSRKLLMSVALNGGESGQATTGEQLLRQQLAEIHRQFWGESLSIDDPEIDASYELLVEMWQDRKVLNGFQRTAINFEVETCEIPIENWWEQDWSEEFSDPQNMMGAWIMMLVYFMTDYRYLHE